MLAMTATGDTFATTRHQIHEANLIHPGQVRILHVDCGDELFRIQLEPVLVIERDLILKKVAVGGNGKTARQ